MPLSCSSQLNTIGFQTAQHLMLSTKKRERYLQRMQKSMSLPADMSVQDFKEVQGQVSLHTALGDLLIHAYLRLKVAPDEFSIAQRNLVLVVSCIHKPSKLCPALLACVCRRREGQKCR